MDKSRKKEKPILAKSIIMRRKLMGFPSAEAFAKAIGIPHATLRDIEAGISQGRESTLQTIAAGLKCKKEDLYSLPSAHSRAIDTDDLKAFFDERISEMRLKFAESLAAQKELAFTLSSGRNVSAADILDRLRTIEPTLREAVLETLFDDGGTLRKNVADSPSSKKRSS